MIRLSGKALLLVAAIACGNDARDAPPPPPAPVRAPNDTSTRRDAGSAVQSYLVIHIAALAGVRRADYFRYINERAYPQFQHCYPPGVIGTTAIDFDVGADGSIAADIGRSFDVEIARCLVDALDSVELPAANAGGHGELVFETRPWR